MNILYFVDADITINRGGVSRVTHFLSRKFMEQPGCHCYLAYLFESKQQPVSDFNGKLRLKYPGDSHQLKEYILQQKIDIVVCSLILKTTIQFYLPILHKIRQETKTVRIIFCYHTYPGYELLRPHLKAHLFHLFHSCRFSRETLIPILTAGLLSTPFKTKIKKYLKKKYHFAFDNTDKIVLLSASYIDSYLKLIQSQDTSRFLAIPNPLTGESASFPSCLSGKKKKVLIVSRLSENPKQLSAALRIWQIIEQEYPLKEWELTIVGTGEDEDYYQYLCRKLKLQRVYFTGWDNPAKYYRESSLFMMTSRYEGWGLTLTEAQQTGVVPVAFDNFTSIHDIITSEKNGYLIPKQNIRLFAEKLVWLMTHDQERQQMARQGFESCQKFSMERVAHQWELLFQELKQINQ